MSTSHRIGQPPRSLSDAERPADRSIDSQTAAQREVVGHSQAFGNSLSANADRGQLFQGKIYARLNGRGECRRELLPRDGQGFAGLPNPAIGFLPLSFQL